MTTKPIIEVKDLKKSFGTLQVLKGINTEVQKGEVVVVIGPSGSGKSTFLRCLNLLETPTAGSIYVDGAEITDPKCDINLHRQKMGMVFQHFNLFNNMTVLKNCTVGQEKVLKKSKEEAHKNAMMYLEKVGMAPYINAKPKQLSGGQKQRVAIARALAKKPTVLFLDEPTGALDEKTGRQVLDVITKLQSEQGFTMIMVTHNINIAEMANTVIKVSDGKIAEVYKNDVRKSAFEIGW